MNATASSQAGNLLDQRRGNDFMVFASLLDLMAMLVNVSRLCTGKGDFAYGAEDSPVVASQVPNGLGIKLHGQKRKNVTNVESVEKVDLHVKVEIYHVLML